jgi:hypothetical protein
MPQSVRLTGIVAAASALVLVAGLVQGGERDGGATIAASIGAGLMHFQFEEFDRQDRRLVKEAGWLPGLEGSLGVRQQAVSLAVDVGYYAGDVDYDGQTSSGVPIDSSTDQRIFEASINAACELPLGLPPRVSVYAGGGYRHWDRDIDSVGAVSGLDETYQWWRAETGVKLQLARGANAWELEAGLTRTLNPQVDVDFGAAFDAVTLDLGERWGWRTAASWSHRVSPQLAAGLEVFYASWDLGQSSVETLTSNGATAGSVFQPRSESRNYGVILSLHRAW